MIQDVLSTVKRLNVPSAGQGLKSILVTATSLTIGVTIAACNPTPADFEVSNLTISPGAVEVYEEVTISADVTNIGGLEGSYMANLSINGTILNTEEVTLAPGETKGVTFNHTPETKGQYTVMVGEASSSLVVTEPPPGQWWVIPCVVTASSISQRMSFIPGSISEYSFKLPEGTGMEIQISKTIANGSREVFLGAAGFRSDPMVLEDVIPGIDSEIVWALEGDALGTLYIEDDVGDVDISAETKPNVKPQTTYTFGDSIPDPAGSWLIHMPMVVEFESLGISDVWPMDVYCTTGHNYNHITFPSDIIDGSEVEGDGTPCASDGGIVPFVGTPFKIVVTGAILDRAVMGVRVDVQFVGEMEVTPIGWE
jgi:hypothetical protein